MKKIIVLVGISCCFFVAGAQVTGCTDLRKPYYSISEIARIDNPGLCYAKPGYEMPDVNYIEDSLSGRACSRATVCIDGSRSLTYDVYYPDIIYSDTNKLPAFVMFHSGGFSDCSSKIQDGSEDMCMQFAQRGYVVFNAEYRRGRIEDSHRKFTSASHWLSYYRAIQDCKGALRTIVTRENAKSQSYRIDTSMIFVGGASSGAQLALAVAFLTEEMMDMLFTGVADVLGSCNEDKYAGNASYNIRGVLNMWGGLPIPLSYSSNPATFIRLNPVRPVLISFHGARDGEMNIDSSNWYFSEETPYCTETLCVGNKTFTMPKNGKKKADMFVLGSQGLYNVLKDELGMKSELYIDCEMEHGLQIGKSDFGLGDIVKNNRVQAYIVERAATFFQYITNTRFPITLTHTRFVGCENYRYGCKPDAKIICNNNTLCQVENISGVQDIIVKKPVEQTGIFQMSQAGKTIVISLMNNSAAIVDMYNITGGRIRSQKVTGSRVTLNCSSAAAGVYILRVTQGIKVQTQKIVFP